MAAVLRKSPNGLSFIYQCCYRFRTCWYTIQIIVGISDIAFFFPGLQAAKGLCVSH